MTSHTLTHATDLDGREVVGVHISNRPVIAWLYRADYERIVQAHGTPAWFLASNGTGRAYVRFKELGNNKRAVPVARLVAGELVKTVVRYRDGDVLNLREGNLYHSEGAGGCRKKQPKRGPFYAFRIGLDDDARG